jgi:hypothetical protein
MTGTEHPLRDSNLYMPIGQQAQKMACLLSSTFGGINIRDSGKAGDIKEWLQMCMTVSSADSKVGGIVHISYSH